MGKAVKSSLSLTFAENLTFTIISNSNTFIIIHIHFCLYKYTVSQKNCADLFSLQLRQISTNLDNFWQKDGKEAEIISDGLIFHLT